MSVVPSKLVVIGFDAPIASKIYEYAMKGELPNIKRLIEEGVYAENCLVPYPTITPPNWTTIVTGAWIGTHGITCFNLHKPGMPLDKTYPAFDSRDCLAEYIWQVAEREGKKTIVVNWPTTWPPTFKNGVQIGGAGLAINEWRPGPMVVCIADPQLFTTQDLPLATPVEFRSAEKWHGIDSTEGMLEAELQLEYPRAKYKVLEPKQWYLLMREEEGKIKVVISPARDLTKAYTTLCVGEWSDIIVETFSTERGPIKGAFKFKLLRASLESKEISLFMTPICALDPKELPSYPEEIGREILENIKELPLPAHGIYRALSLGWIDVDTWLEAIDIEHRWLASTVTYLMRRIDWSMVFLHAHCPDWAYHAFMRKLEPPGPEEAGEEELYRKAELGFYKSLDRMVGRILEKVDLSETIVVLVSDHGAKPHLYARPSILKILAEAGLADYRVEEDGKIVINWEKTKAVPQRAAYIYINLKGRDPHGIVDPKDYDKVRDEVIRALYDYTDPETGIKPIILALKKEDARIIGLYGDRVGDIVYAIDPRYRGEHGTFLPTGELKARSLKGLLIMAGPGIKRGYVMERTCWLTDIVPTVCYLMELPIPRNTEGAILYQALEDPNIKLKELRRLREEYRKLKIKYERLQRTIESEKYLTHKYEL